jgi:hypothetical protein
MHLVARVVVDAGVMHLVARVVVDASWPSLDGLSKTSK